MNWTVAIKSDFFFCGGANLTLKNNKFNFAINLTKKDSKMNSPPSSPHPLQKTHKNTNMNEYDAVITMTSAWDMSY